MPLRSGGALLLHPRSGVEGLRNPRPLLPPNFDIAISPAVLLDLLDGLRSLSSWLLAAGRNLKHMASAILASGNEPHWGESRVYMRKYTHNSNNPQHFSRLNPNPNPSVNRDINQNPNPIPNRLVRNSSSRAHGRQIDEPSPRSALPVASNRTADLEKESSQGRHITFHLESYSRRELKELRKRFILELDQVQIFRSRIEGRELQSRSNHRISTGSQDRECIGPSSDIAPTAPPKGKKKVAKPAGKNNKISGKKRTMPFISLPGSKRPAVEDSQTRKIATGMMRRCGQILGKLMKHRYGSAFNKPVDVEGLGLHDYEEIIKHPMDLGTVKSRLGEHVYASPLDFASDIRLTFENALTYNPDGTLVNGMASFLLKMFEEAFVPAYQKFEAQYQLVLDAQKGMPDNAKKSFPDLIHSQGALSNLQSLDSSPAPVSLNPVQIRASITPTQVQVPATPTHTLIQESASVLPTPVVAPVMEAAKAVGMQQKSAKVLKPKAKGQNKREMSFEEREQLALDMQNLQADRLDQMLQIVMKRNSQLAPDGDGEIELDIQALDNETLWELHGFLSCNNKAVNKMEKEEPMNNSISSLQINKSPVGEQLLDAAAMHKNKKWGDVAEEDVDIGEEMPMTNYPPVQIEKDVAPANSGPSESSSSSSSSSGSDHSSSSDSDSGSSSGDDSDSVQK